VRERLGNLREAALHDVGDDLVGHLKHHDTAVVLGEGQVALLIEYLQ
jgi:hypothetical protein